MLDDAQLKKLILDVLKVPTVRTQQRKIGASGIGNPCAYCLATSLIGGQGGKIGQYWLGARIGDAIHALLEHEAEKYLNTTNGKFKYFAGARLEKSVYIGTVPNYGDIYSTPDLYLTAENHLVDYKTSKRSKVDMYRLDNSTIPTQYIYQVMLYARALIAAGHPVDKISFVFINRDGTSDRDVVVISFDYDETLANEAWDRLLLAWQWLEDGNDPETLPSDPNCYVCSNVLHRMGP